MLFEILSAAFVAVLLYIVFVKFKVKARIGPPPVQCQLIAYKYSFINHSNAERKFATFNSLFPGSKTLKIYYCNEKGKAFEFAYGAVVQEGYEVHDLCEYLGLLKNGVSLFVTPAIDNAVWARISVIPWLPLSRWIAIATAYSKIYDVIEKNAMYAYPAIEIYGYNSVSVIVPLSQQDEFVVPEARRIVYGHKTSALLNPLLCKYKPIEPLNTKPVQKQKKKSTVSLNKKRQG